jgi:transcriptional antiterminator NusG
MPGVRHETGAVVSAERVAGESVMTDEQASAAGESDRMQWYVLKITSNREKSIRENILRRIRQEGLEEYIGEIVIPTEKVVENKAGKKKVTEHKLYPGYLMIQMVLNDDTWYVIRSTSGVGDFTGAAGKPIAMQDHEIQRMLGHEERRTEEPVKVKMDFQTGDVVKIKDGAFDGFEGTIDGIDDANGKITVLIEIFGRSTPVDLEYWQVERV